MFKSIRESVFFKDSFVNVDEGDDSEEQFEECDETDENGDRVKKFTAKETRRVRIWRWLVIIILLVAGASTSVLTYLLLHGEEEEDFETSYNLFADATKDVSINRYYDIKNAFQGLAETITGAAIANQQKFPFVTVPQFEIQGENARKTSGVEVISYAPLVSEGQRRQWEEFAWNNQDWLEESRAYSRTGEEVLHTSVYFETPINPYIYQFDPIDDSTLIPAVDSPFLPAWHTSPPPFFPGYINYNLMAQEVVKYSYPLVQSMRQSLQSMIFDMSALGSTAINEEDHDLYHAQFIDGLSNSTTSAWEIPHSLVMVPVFEDLNDIQSTIVGIVFGVLPWDRYLSNLLPEGKSGIYVLLKNNCGQTHTYKLVGSKSIYLGEGALHEKGWERMKVTINLYDDGAPLIDGNCLFSFEVYPSDEFHNEWDSSLPKVFACVVAATFVLMAVTFFIYDTFTRRRNKKVVKAATKTDKIVSSLFPSNIRDRLLAEDEEDFEKQKTDRGTRTRMKDFLAQNGKNAVNSETTDDFMFKTRPLADLFPETTIMFADISGFSAWSSTREPSQVFLLLETVYKAFDDIAKRRRIFKVETVGDCYVAAAGLPEARKDHAVAIARFARECMIKMFSLTQKLEMTLGPDTADLSLRVGLHSGPVTAGVLRGERSRFQLFGDTMNTASRMESTGLSRKIQVSQETADLLLAAGKGNWLAKREDTVVAKGKGELTCYWLLLPTENKSEIPSSRDASSEDEDASYISEESNFEVVEEEEVAGEKQKAASAKTSRLINWNKELLSKLLKRIVARRQALAGEEHKSGLAEDIDRDDGMTILDEVQEIVALPAFDPSVTKKEVHPDTIDLGEEVEKQLGSFVATIASMYRENPFHCFDHASHVTLSVSKLLTRIVAPTDVDFSIQVASKSQMLHDHTYGITSDPLTQFSCVLSALIHDVDHTGVPNTQLVNENKTLAAYYKGRSVAEQNSVDVAWELLMDPAFAELRHTIYQTQDEMKRFRQLVVNSVMATDIMDKDLKDLRNKRWEKAFSNATDSDSSENAVNRKATIVIEHLIQASDVAHTMQHWHIYRKWNERLFHEMYIAYKNGRAEKDPSTFWYQGEIGFFDFYIIPLAKKLKECGVFGVSSDEYLQYAQQNRQEWVQKGQQVVSELIESVKAMY